MAKLTVSFEGQRGIKGVLLKITVTVTFLAYFSLSTQSFEIFIVFKPVLIRRNLYSTNSLYSTKSVLKVAAYCKLVRLICG